MCLKLWRPGGEHKGLVRASVAAFSPLSPSCFPSPLALSPPTFEEPMNETLESGLLHMGRSAPPPSLLLGEIRVICKMRTCVYLDSLPFSLSQ